MSGVKEITTTTTTKVATNTSAIAAATWALSYPDPSPLLQPRRLQGPPKPGLLSLLLLVTVVRQRHHGTVARERGNARTTQTNTVPRTRVRYRNPTRNLGLPRSITRVGSLRTLVVPAPSLGLPTIASIAADATRLWTRGPPRADDRRAPALSAEFEFAEMRFIRSPMVSPEVLRRTSRRQASCARAASSATLLSSVPVAGPPPSFTAPANSTHRHSIPNTRVVQITPMPSSSSVRSPSQMAVSQEGPVAKSLRSAMAIDDFNVNVLRVGHVHRSLITAAARQRPGPLGSKTRRQVGTAAAHAPCNLSDDGPVHDV